MSIYIFIIKIRVKGYITHHKDGCFLAIHKSLGQNVGCEDFVSLSEFLEGDSVGETLVKKMNKQLKLLLIQK